jgi:hypothetical protein
MSEFWNTYVSLRIAVVLLLPLSAVECRSEDQPPSTNISRPSQWKCPASTTAPPPGSNSVSLEDTNGNSGTAGFGYGDASDGTVLSDMRRQFSKISLRRTFDLAD